MCQSDGNENVVPQASLAFKCDGGESRTGTKVKDSFSKFIEIGVNIKVDELHEQLSVDEILQKWVGEFGRAQLVHFVFVNLAWTIDAMHTMVMIFAAREPPWRCLNAPASVGSVAQINGSMGCSSAYSLCEMDSRDWEWIGGKEGSIVSKWGLICGESYKIGLVDSLFFIGACCGAGIFGSLSDSFLGRKGVLQLICIISASVSLATGFSPNYWTYTVLRFMSGICSGGFGAASFVLSTELIGPSWRGVVAMSIFYFFSTGIMVLSILAYASPSLRYLYIFVSIPTFLYFCLILPFVSESPRWYIVRGRADDAMKVLRSFARINGRSVPPGVELASEISNGKEISNSNKQKSNMSPVISVAELASEFSASKEVFDASGEINHVNPVAYVASPLVNYSPLHKHTGVVDGSLAAKASGTLVDVFRYEETRMRMMVMMIVWFGTATVYYGISLNVVNIGSNVYLNVFLNALSEIPAFAISAFLLKRLGRRNLLVGSMLLSGSSCLIAAVLTSQLHNPTSLHNTSSTVAAHNSATSSYIQVHKSSYGSEEHTLIRIGGVVCGMLGIFGMASSYNLIYLYTLELFPTVVRNAALGLASQASQLGAVSAPFVVVLGHIFPSLPFAIFTLSGILAGLLSLRLPETLNRSLWDTLEGLKKGEIEEQMKNIPKSSE